MRCIQNGHCEDLFVFTFEEFHRLLLTEFSDYFFYCILLTMNFGNKKKTLQSFFCLFLYFSLFSCRIRESSSFNSYSFNTILIPTTSTTSTINSIAWRSFPQNG